MKKILSISIEEEDERELKQLCAILGIPVSQLFQEAARGYVKAAKMSGLFEKKTASKLALIKLFAKGAMLDPSR